MASLPSQHPTLSVHLTDLTLTPLITSSSSPTHLESLTSLASSAITSQTAVQRANLGRPQRIIVEYPDSGAVVLQSYIDPQESSYRADDSNSQPSEHKPTPLGSIADDGRDDAAKGDETAPVLVGVVVASSSDDAREARRAAAKLERVGREVQKEWAAQGLGRDTDRGSSPE